MKLAFWPDKGDESEIDLDWDWLKGYEKLRIGEMRIDEPINAKNNIRIIFFKANISLRGEPFPRIWLLSVFAKKRQDFGKGQLAAWKARRKTIIDRQYGASSEV